MIETWGLRGDSAALVSRRLLGWKEWLKLGAESGRGPQRQRGHGRARANKQLVRGRGPQERRITDTFDGQDGLGPRGGHKNHLFLGLGVVSVKKYRFGFQKSSKTMKFRS